MCLSQNLWTPPGGFKFSSRENHPKGVPLAARPGREAVLDEFEKENSPEAAAGEEAAVQAGV